MVYVYRQTRPGVDAECDSVEIAQLPKRGTEEAAGMDVYAFLPRPMTVKPLETVKVPTGLHFAIPPRSAMLICSRSGLASKGLMVANGPGILDSDYRGELLVLLTYVTSPAASPFVINNGDRIAQIMFVDADSINHPPFMTTISVDTLPLPQSSRTGGFGSTGV